MTAPQNRDLLEDQMKFNRSAVRRVAAATVTLGALGIAAPANAETVQITDPADASASLNDVRAIRLEHAPQRVKFQIRVTDLQEFSEAGPAGASIFFDTDRDRSGPEYAIGTGLQSGTDYQLVSVNGWGFRDADLVDCAHRLSLNYETNTVVGSIKRKCIGAPDSVRMSVLMVDQYDGSHPVRDWAPGFRKWTPSAERA